MIARAGFILCFAVGAAGCRVTKPAVAARPSAPGVSVSAGTLDDARTPVEDLSRSFVNIYNRLGEPGAARYAGRFPDRAIELLRNGALPPEARAALDSAFGKISIAGRSGGRRAEAEAAMTQGLSLQQKGETGAAAAIFERGYAIAKAENIDYLIFQIGVAMCEPRADGGRVAGWQSIWREAVAAGASVADTAWWRRALACGGDLIQWPPETGGESKIYLQLANWELERNEPANALLHCAHAAASAVDDGTRTAAELTRARAFYQLGRRAEALAIAIKIGGRPEGGAELTHERRDALALVAVIEAELDRLDDARSNLERAFENATHWPGAARAHSDLAIILLRLHDELGAMKNFKLAIEKANVDADFATMARTLENLRKYLKLQNADTRAVEEQLATLARERGVAPDLE
ncbi:MAG: hypothetical protein HY286_01800 [Planctomycetes bacterium]|nr:hypothetical protein [Planctomycetota bacterium]